MNNASITFFMPSSPPSHRIIAIQAKSDRGPVGPANGFLQLLPLIGMSVFSVMKCHGDVNKI
jgi:hypothetical protein